MLTKEQILIYLNNDSWFTPSRSNEKYKIQIGDNTTIEVAKSYYHIFDEIGQIVIRVSEHGTYLNTWVKHKDDPTISLQNLSVVFTNTPVEYSTKIEPREIEKEDGSITTEYIYFVVEQYVYRLDNLNEKDFKTVIKQIKTLSNSKVFRDPLKKKPSKVASRTVLTPTDLNNRPIPPTKNSIHSRQTIVANNKNKEIDAKGNIIPENKRSTLKIKENKLKHIIRKYLSEETLSQKSVMYKQVKPHPFVINDNGKKVTPVVSLKARNNYSSVIEDDGCYVLYDGNDEDGYRQATYWFPEIFNAMKKIPNLPLR